MTDRIVVEGDTRLQATLTIAADRVQDMSDPGKATAAFVAGRGRADAPVLTGRLANSLSTSVDETDAQVGSGLPYANRVHWGYRRYAQRAQPFLASAVWNNQTLITQNYARRIDYVLAGVKGA